MIRLASILTCVILAITIVANTLFFADRAELNDILCVEIAHADLQMGSVAEQVDLRHSISIRNVHPSRSVDIALAASCHCTAISPSELHLSPGESRQVEFAIDLTPAPPQFSTRFDRPFSVKLIAKDRGSGKKFRSRQWDLTATVHRSVIADPPAVHLSGAHEIIQGVPGVFRVNLQSKVPLKKVSADLRPQIGSIAAHKSGDHYFLEYSYGGEGLPSEFKANIYVTALAQSGEAIPEIIIPVIGRVVPPYRMTPGHIAFSPLPIGMEATRNLSLISLHGKPFHVELPDSIPQELTLEVNDQSSSGASQSINARMRLTKAGDHSWEIPIKIRAIPDEETPVELSLIVRAYGMNTENSTASTIEKRRP